MILFKLLLFFFPSSSFVGLLFLFFFHTLPLFYSLPFSILLLLPLPTPLRYTALFLYYPSFSSPSSFACSFFLPFSFLLPSSLPLRYFLLPLPPPRPYWVLGREGLACKGGSIMGLRCKGGENEESPPRQGSRRNSKKVPRWIWGEGREGEALRHLKTETQKRTQPPPPKKKC